MSSEETKYGVEYAIQSFPKFKAQLYSFKHA